MDIYNLYMGEGYGSMRNPVTFRDYEKHPYGSWEKTASNKGSYYQQQQNKAYSGGHSWKRPSRVYLDRINIFLSKLISHFEVMVKTQENNFFGSASKFTDAINIRI